MKQNFIVICMLFLGGVSGLACQIFTKSPSPPAAQGRRLAEPLPPEQSPSVSAGLAGGYTVAGKNPDGTNYEGELEIIKRGAVYQFRWDVGRLYDGIGIENGGIVAVSFSDGKDGSGCGVVNYRLGASGVLEGKWGYWGVNEGATESATRLGKRGPLAGAYIISGKGMNNESYGGRLSIKPTGAGYHFSWDNGTDGFGIRLGDNVVSGIGGAECEFVAYQIEPDGTLKGIWGGGGDKETGYEQAVKK